MTPDQILDLTVTDFDRHAKFATDVLAAQRVHINQ